MKEEIKKKPVVTEVFTDNGEHSYYILVDPETNEKLWSEDPNECKAMGYPVSCQPHYIAKDKVMEIIEKAYSVGFKSACDEEFGSPSVSIIKCENILKEEYGL